MQACEACGEEKGRTLALVMGVWELGGARPKYASAVDRLIKLSSLPHPCSALFVINCLFFFSWKVINVHGLKKKNQIYFYFIPPTSQSPSKGGQTVFFLLQGYPDILETYTHISPFHFHR